MSEAPDLKPIEMRLRAQRSRAGNASLYSPALRVRTLAAIDSARRQREQRQLTLLIGPASLVLIALFVVLPVAFVTFGLEWLGLTRNLALGLALLLIHGTGAAVGASLAVPLFQRHQRLHTLKGAIGS